MTVSLSWCQLPIYHERRSLGRAIRLHRCCLARKAVRITLYRPVRDDEGDFIYTRIKGTIGRGCEAFYDGHRWCDPVGHKHHFHSKVTL